MRERVAQPCGTMAAFQRHLNYRTEKLMHVECVRIEIVETKNDRQTQVSFENEYNNFTLYFPANDSGCVVGHWYTFSWVDGIDFTHLQKLYRCGTINCKNCADLPGKWCHIYRCRTCAELAQ